MERAEYQRGYRQACEDVTHFDESVAVRELRDALEAIVDLDDGDHRADLMHYRRKFWTATDIARKALNA
jgi:hypothetical protein